MARQAQAWVRVEHAPPPERATRRLAPPRRARAGSLGRLRQGISGTSARVMLALGILTSLIAIIDLYLLATALPH